METDLTTDSEKYWGRIRKICTGLFSGLLDWAELSVVGEHKLATLVQKCVDGDLNGLGTEACSCCSAKVACKGMSALYSYLPLWNML